MAVKPIPDGYHTVTPYLIMKKAGAAIDFYKKAFGAKELFRMPGPNGAVMHAEIQIGNSIIMLADEYPDMGFVGPETRGGATSSILLYVEDVDSFVKKVETAGAKTLRPLQDQFYGDRSATYADPFGHVWTVATHKEDLTPEEIEKRKMAQHGKQCA